MKKKYLKTKIVLKKNITKKDFNQIFELIKRENSYSILSKLNKELIYEYLKIVIKSKKLFLLIIETNQKILGYILFARNEADLLNEFKKMKIKILIYLILNIKIIDLMNIFMVITKIDKLFSNYLESKDTLNLNLLAIKSDYQSMGLGKILLNKSLKKLSTEGIKFKYITCEAPTIRSLKFYKKNNFRLIGKKIRFFNNLFLLKRKYEF